MHRQPVVVAPPFLSNYHSLFKYAVLSAVICVLPFGLSAQEGKTAPTPYIAQEEMSGYLARIGYNDPEQLAEALMRVEGLYDFDAGSQLPDPVAIVVHGPEVSIFQRENYLIHKEIVDLAARLSALGILDISVCETRLSLEGAEKDSVYPFVDTVPFGPAEVDRLLVEENYVYF